MVSSLLDALPVERYLLDSLSWEQKSEFDQLAPQTLEVPSGKVIMLDYVPCLCQCPPVLAMKLQEAFGWRVTPTVVNGGVAVMIHLLSPARRPLQVTQDLMSFWQNGYPEVRKEMRGRYPRHPWPEDPLTATATDRFAVMLIRCAFLGSRSEYDSVPFLPVLLRSVYFLLLAPHRLRFPVSRRARYTSYNLLAAVMGK